MVNLYAELAPEGKDVGALFGTPGLTLLATLGTGPIRGVFSYFDYFLYVVSGNELFQLDRSLAAVNLGTIGGSGPVTITTNSDHVLISAGDYLYQYDLGTSTLTSTGQPGGSVCFIDSWFVYNQPDSQIIWIYDGVTFDPLDFAQAEGAPDHIVRVFADHRELWLFGKISTEVWYNNGDADFPFAPIQGAFIERGCAATYSVTKVDNSLFWLGAGEDGYGVVWRANGYTPVRVSTNAVELAIRSYSDVSDAIAWSYQQDGHTFYVLTFPTGNATWVFDASTNLWHERAYMNQSTGELGRHRGNCGCYFQKRNIVGDFENGNLYAFDLDTYTDNGDYIKAIRAWRALPQGQNRLDRTFQHALQLDAETGVGLTSGQGSDPLVWLRWSDDGGHTWSNFHSRTLGAIGETGHRTIWRRLGSTEKLRDRVYEISLTDPVKRAFVGAQLLGISAGGS
jgi:hypothetical protein